MKKYFPILLVAVVLMIVFLTQPVRRTLGIIDKTPSLMDEILKDTGGELSEVQILAWAKMNSQFMSVVEMKNTLAQIDNTYYNTRCVPKFHVEENYKSCEILTQIAPHKSLQLTLQTYRPASKSSGLTPESYMLMELAQNDKSYSLNDLKKEATNSFHHLNAAPDLTITYTAKIRGKITSAKQEELSKKVKETLHLNNAEEFSTANFFGLTGYSSAFPTELVLAGKKRNFSLNIRYNPEDDQTYIIYGTPDIGGQD